MKPLITKAGQMKTEQDGAVVNEGALSEVSGQMERVLFIEWPEQPDRVVINGVNYVLSDPD